MFVLVLRNHVTLHTCTRKILWIIFCVQFYGFFFYSELTPIRAIQVCGEVFFWMTVICHHITPSIAVSMHIFVKLYASSKTPQLLCASVAWQKRLSLFLLSGIRPELTRVQKNGFFKSPTQWVLLGFGVLLGLFWTSRKKIGKIIQKLSNLKP